MKPLHFKIILGLCFMMCLYHEGLYAQQRKSKPLHKKTEASVKDKSKDADDHMLKPDENTVYFDEDGNMVTAAAFSEKLQKGTYNFVPEAAGNKLISIRLKKLNDILNAGSAFKDFSFTDMKGKNWNLQSLKGKIVVLNFWFTSCVPCRAEMPELNKLADSYKDNDNVVFLAVTYDNKEVVEQFLKEHRFAYNIIPDQRTAIKELGVSSYPTSVILDREGKVKRVFSGYRSDTVTQIGEDVKNM